MDWEQVYVALKEENERIRKTFGIRIEIYGSGRQGYEVLSNCINDGVYWYRGDFSIKEIPAPEIWNGNKRLSQILRKQIHEYWTFMIMLENLLYGYKYEGVEHFIYQPTRGNDSQSPILRTPRGSLFVEPCLTRYKEEEILSIWGNKLHYLQKPSSLPIRPDFLLTKFGTIDIPWGAWTWRYIGEEVWEEFSTNVKYIIECKWRTPTSKDLNQILWYSLAYKKPIIFIIQEEMREKMKEKFQKDIEKLETDIHIIENFKVGYRESCISKLTILKELKPEIL